MSKKIPSIPREMSEIQKDYQQSAFKAGQVQYQIRILERELEGLNQDIEKFNKEAAARNELDAQVKKQLAEAQKEQENEAKS